MPAKAPDAGRAPGDGRPSVTWPASTTALAGLIGYPTRHSLSPRLHNAALAALGLDWCYVAFEVPPPFLEKAVAGAAALGLRALSVTMPHKDGAARLATRHSRQVRRLGAANTLIFERGSIRAENCDGAGLLDDLRVGEGFDPAGRACGVIGAGGTARAAVLALAEAGASEIVVVNRTAVRAWRAIALAPKIARVGRPDELKAMDLIVQATPAHMSAPGAGSDHLTRRLAIDKEPTGSTARDHWGPSDNPVTESQTAGSNDSAVSGQTAPTTWPAGEQAPDETRESARPVGQPAEPDGPYGSVGASGSEGLGNIAEEAAPGLSAVVSGVDPSWFGEGQLVVDVVYNPAITPFLAAAERQGARVRGGLGMLVHQAGRQVALFTGMPAPLEVMWDVVGGDHQMRSGPG